MSSVVVVKLEAVRSTERHDDHYKQESDDCGAYRCCRKEDRPCGGRPSCCMMNRGAPAMVLLLWNGPWNPHPCDNHFRSLSPRKGRRQVDASSLAESQKLLVTFISGRLGDEIHRLLSIRIGKSDNLRLRRRACEPFRSSFRDQDLEGTPDSTSWGRETPHISFGGGEDPSKIETQKRYLHHNVCLWPSSPFRRLTFHAF